MPNNCEEALLHLDGASAEAKEKGEGNIIAIARLGDGEHSLGLGRRRLGFAKDYLINRRGKMGYIFIFLFTLSVVWYYAFYEILLRIGRTHYRRNWEKETKDIAWLHNRDVWVSLRGQVAYRSLAFSWFFSTPVWAQDHKLAYRLLWCWRLGYVVVILALAGMFFGPILMDVLL